MGFIIRKSIFYDMMDGNQLEYEFDNRDLDHITFKGDGKESFSFNRALVENLIETDIRNKDQYSERNVYHMITKQDIQAAASYIFRSSFVSEDQARKAMVKAGNNATKILVKTFRGKLFKKAFERARRGKDISSFERQEKESGFNFLHNPNNGR